MLLWFTRILFIRPTITAPFLWVNICRTTAFTDITCHTQFSDQPFSASYFTNSLARNHIYKSILLAVQPPTAHSYQIHWHKASTDFERGKSNEYFMLRKHLWFTSEYTERDGILCAVEWPRVCFSVQLGGVVWRADNEEMLLQILQCHGIVSRHDALSFPFWMSVCVDTIDLCGRKAFFFHLVDVVVASSK